MEDKERFYKPEKMLRYYFMEKPMYTLVEWTRSLIGIERYDGICEFLENLRKS